LQGSAPQGLFRRAPPRTPLKDFLKKVLENPKNFERNGCLFVHIGFGYTFSLLTPPVNSPFRAPRDHFKRKSIRKTSKNTTPPKNKTLYFRGFHKGEAQAPPCAGYSRAEPLNRLFIQYFWRSKNIGGVQGEESCRTRENMFALSLSHHRYSQLFPQHFYQAKILAGCRARSPVLIFSQGVAPHPTKETF